MEIRNKITIREKDSVECPMRDLIATLRWKSSVDLDLWCFVKTKDVREHQIGFSNRGTLQSNPFIQLDHDAGVGDVGGNNEENIRIKTLEHIDHAFICANIFGKNGAIFAKYDGSVVVKNTEKEFTVPLTSKEPGNWCVIAHLDNTGKTPQLININHTITRKPKLEQLITGNFATVQKKGFMSKIFGG